MMQIHPGLQLSAASGVPGGFGSPECYWPTDMKFNFYIDAISATQKDMAIFRVKRRYDNRGQHIIHGIVHAFGSPHLG